MAAYAHYDSGFFHSRRAISLIAIIGVHILLIWGFSSGLATRVIDDIAPAIQTEIVQEVQKRDDPTPPPPPKMERPPVELPLPDVAINLPVDAQSTAIADVTERPVPPASPPPLPPESVTAPFGRAGYLNNPPPEYPPTAARQGWQGTVLLRVRVLSTGKVETVQIERSSGHRLLDDQAIATVLTWLFAPAKRGATPIDGWATVPIEFKLDT